MVRNFMMLSMASPSDFTAAMDCSFASVHVDKSHGIDDLRLCRRLSLLLDDEAFKVECQWANS